jgi:hypothetical protein
MNGRPRPTLDVNRFRGVFGGAAGLRGEAIKLRPLLRLAQERADLFPTAMEGALDDAGQARVRPVRAGRDGSVG